MTLADQDRYFAEMADIGTMLGADPVPRSKAEARHIIADMRAAPAQRCPHPRNGRTSCSTARPTTNSPNRSSRLTGQSAVDLLPDWARRMHGLPAPPFAPFVRAGTLGMARTLRWAFA